MINTKTVEYKNFDICKVCGGLCCKIYSHDSVILADGNTYFARQGMWFDEFVEAFHPKRESYEVEPPFDPLDVHMSSHEALYQGLLSRGIDPEFCEYRGSSGCMIKWRKRPFQCKVFKCGKLSERDRV